MVVLRSRETVRILRVHGLCERRARSLISADAYHHQVWGPTLPASVQDATAEVAKVPSPNSGRGSGPPLMPIS